VVNIDGAPTARTFPSELRATDCPNSSEIINPSIGEPSSFQGFVRPSNLKTRTCPLLPKARGAPTARTCPSELRATDCPNSSLEVNPSIGEPASFQGFVGLSNLKTRTCPLLTKARGAPTARRCPSELRATDCPNSSEVINPSIGEP